MRRTQADSRPGCEHSRALAPLVALTALLLAAPVGAQDPQDPRDPVDEPPPQEVRGGHEVVRGNTLWELAESFYGNPYLWPRIWEANRDRIEDPHWIYPGQVLRIPGEDGELVEVVVAPGADPRERDMRPAARVQERPGDRTIFYPGMERTRIGTILPRTEFYPVAADEMDLVVGAAARTRLALSHSSFYGAEWLSRLDEEELPYHIGRVHSFTGAEGNRTERVTSLPFESLQIALPPGEVASVGDLLQTFRVARTEEVGTILRPTGVMVVTEVAPAGVVAMVSASFDQIRIGDLVRPAPRFPLQRGVQAQPVEEGLRARIIAVGQERALQSLRNVMILDAGSDAGVRVGDEFVLVTRDRGWPGVVEGSVQVVGVRPGSSSARIIDVNYPAFEVGAVLNRSARMP